MERMGPLRLVPVSCFGCMEAMRPGDAGVQITILSGVLDEASLSVFPDTLQVSIS